MAEMVLVRDYMAARRRFEPLGEDAVRLRPNPRSSAICDATFPIAISNAISRVRRAVGIQSSREVRSCDVMRHRSRANV